MRPAMTRLLRTAVAALGLLLLGAAQPHGQADLQGRITVQELYAAFPVFRAGADAYRPDPAAVEALARIGRETKLVAFLGTWCPDSRSEIPALLKTLDMARNPRLKLELYAVDRIMDDGIGVADRLNLQGVPTVIVFRGGREAGRIQGLARDSMETDLLAIMQRTR